MKKTCVGKQNGRFGVNVLNLCNHLTLTMSIRFPASARCHISLINAGIRRLLLWGLLLQVPFLSARAQDANYWSNNYGPGGFFTPGAVVANNRDSGVLFYNPALLALTQKKAASISGAIYQVESIRIKDGAGVGKPLKSRVVSQIPQMLSGTVAFGKKKPVYISYALTHSSIINYSVSQRRDAHLNVLNDGHSPGDEYYIGQYSFQNLARETGALISSGFRLTDRLAIGFTAEAQSRSQRYDESIIVRALVNNSSSTMLPLSSNEGLYEVSYHHTGVKLRAGLSYDVNRHHIGLMVSSPLIHVMGGATLLSDNALANIHFDAQDTINLLASTRQTKVKTTYKTPLSIAAGYAYDHGHGQFYVAAEYFLSVKEYNIVTPRNEFFLRPDTGRSNELTQSLLEMREGRKPVLNVAIGYSRLLMPYLTGYIALRTDFNYAKRTDTDGFSPNTSTWDNYYCQLGVNLRRRRYNLRAGLLLGYGHTSQYQQPVNFDDPKESNFLIGTIGTVPATHFLGAVMLAYVHNL